MKLVGNTCSALCLLADGISCQQHGCVIVFTQTRMLV